MRRKGESERSHGLLISHLHISLAGFCIDLRDQFRPNIFKRMLQLIDTTDKSFQQSFMTSQSCPKVRSQSPFPLSES